VQLLLVIGIKYWLPGVDRDSWWYLFRAYGMNVLVYQFYFIAGAFVAIHYDQVDKFIEKNHRVIGWSTLVMAIGTVFLFFGNQNILKLSMSATESIHQPFIFIYDTFMIAFVFWIGRQYAHARNNGLPKIIDRAVSNMAKVSFRDLSSSDDSHYIAIWHSQRDKGTFNRHVVVIAIRIRICIGGAFLISWFCYKVPPFGILIGRPQWHLTKGVKKYVRNNESIKQTVKE
jgi:hypothetical protein